MQLLLGRCGPDTELTVSADPVPCGVEHAKKLCAACGRTDVTLFINGMPCGVEYTSSCAAVAQARHVVSWLARVRAFGAQGTKGRRPARH